MKAVLKGKNGFILQADYTGTAPDDTFTLKVTHSRVYKFATCTRPYINTSAEHLADAFDELVGMAELWPTRYRSAYLMFLTNVMVGVLATLRGQRDGH